jgi:hypothetical protein
VDFPEDYWRYIGTEVRVHTKTDVPAEFSVTGSTAVAVEDRPAERSTVGGPFSDAAGPDREG